MNPPDVKIQISRKALKTMLPGKFSGLNVGNVDNKLKGLLNSLLVNVTRFNFSRLRH